MATALSVCAAVLGAQLVTEPAYAVEKHRNGTVSITFRELADPKAATADLRAAGLPAQVLTLRGPGGCPSPAGSGEPWQSRRASPPPKHWAIFQTVGSAEFRNEVAGYLTTTESNPSDPWGLKLTFAPAAVPKGAVVLIVQYEQGGGHVVGMGLMRSPVPSCWEKDPAIG